jgi:SAM-dependent methyltransferase
VSSPQQSIKFDRAAGIYDATRGFPPGIDVRVAELFARAGGLSRASRVLEIGVGTGRIAMPLAPHVGSYVGIDLSGPMLAKLVAKRDKLPIRVALGDVTRLPFASGSFDAVVAVHVFHLIPGWREVLAEIERVLAPSGLLLHGSDDQSRGEVWRRWRERVEQNHKAVNVGVPRAEIPRFPEGEGWRPAGVEKIAYSRTVRPRTLVELLGSNSFSMTWRMTGQELARAVEGLREDLVQAFGDLDRETEIDSGFWVHAYQPPRGVR